MPDEHDDEEHPGFLPDGEVATYLKRQWARFRAVPASKKVGALNILFGVLGVVGATLSLAGLSRTQGELWEAEDAASAYLVKQQVPGTGAGGPEVPPDVEEARETAFAVMQRTTEKFMARALPATDLRLLVAGFLAMSGVMLLTMGRGARVFSCIVLWSVPAEFVITCAIFGGLIEPAWASALARVASATGSSSRAVYGGLLLIGVAWVAVYPWLALRALRREAATQMPSVDGGREVGDG